MTRGAQRTSPLADERFRRLFTAQIVALIGTGLLTVALGLVAFDIADGDAGEVLGTALAIKMIAYVGVAPVAAAVTVRFERKTVLVAADIVRAAVALLLPFVDHPWQIYVLVFVLHAASATFTPAFQSVIPSLLRDDDTYTRALSLSRLAYDLESVVSPLIAAVLLTVMSYNVLFVGTAVGFAVSMGLVRSTDVPRIRSRVSPAFFDRLTRGVREFGRSRTLRALAAMNLVDAAVTSLVVVNSVVVARVVLGGPEWALAVLLGCFGLGSMSTALLVPRLLTRITDRALTTAGCVAAATVLAATAAALGVGIAGPAGWASAVALWTAAGASASAIGTPSSRLVRRAANEDDPAPLFTAQFSLSHACFLLTYPIAGWVGAAAGQLVATVVLAVVATLGTIAAILAWSLGGGTHGSNARARAELRAFGRT